MKDHISEEEFMLEFFGVIGGHELADPVQTFTDNPNDIIPFVEMCAKEKKPAFISVNPRRKHDVILGIEKVFFDFDYGIKSDNLTKEEADVNLEELKTEVKKFVSYIKHEMNLNPLIIKTRKGYHIHVYLDSVYEVSKNEAVWKVVYRKIQEYIVGSFSTNTNTELKYIDSPCIGNIKSMCRIPFSIHQKSGKKCIIVDTELKKAKIRGISYHRNFGIKIDKVKLFYEVAVKEVEEHEKLLLEIRGKNKSAWEVTHGFTGTIRPCFQHMLESKEMDHYQRRAMLWEAWYSGKQTFEELFDVFSKLNDFDDKLTGYHVGRFIDLGEFRNSRPYKCETIREKGWCLHDRCPIYLKQKEKEKTGQAKGKKSQRKK